MICDIIKAINSKVKICLKDSSEYYFIESLTLIDGNSIEFEDSLSRKKITLQNILVEEMSIITFGINTVPTQSIINDINDGVNDFFTENQESHNISNKEFDALVDKCREYIEYFNDSIVLIKKAVVENNTVDLERLKALGSNRVISLPLATMEENLYIRNLYWKLIDTKLNEAIAEIDSSLEGIDDEDFIEEAKIIKSDLQQNVLDFEEHMKGVTYDRLFNQWPTLLNPSPFSNV